MPIFFKLLFLAFFFFASSANSLAEYMISTVAGNGTGGFSGDGGNATSAQFNNPYDVALDSSGNIYIADYSNGRVRKIKNGTISTIAEGLSSIGVAVDTSGNIYIADYGNHRVRKLSTNGNISTIAGNGTAGFSGDNGQATSAKLNYPFGVAVDSSGNIYIADSHNHRIRKVSTNGTITTIAGDGNATTLQYPYRVAVDASGNIYIADSHNNRIRKVSTNGNISTIAGNGTAGFSGDSGQATSANLNYPFGVTVDASGNIYIVDQGNQRIRKINTNGIITTIAGNGTGGFGGDGGQATSANLNNPTGVAVDASGNIYIADINNHRIRKLTPMYAFKSTTFIKPTEGQITIPIIYYGNGSGQISYSIEDDTAKANIDYLASGGNLSFDSNNRVKTFSLIALANSERITDRTVKLKFNDPDSTQTAILTIAGTERLKWPYKQDFSYSMPGAGWTYYSSEDFARIQVINGKLRMDVDKDGSYALNEAMFLLDLTFAEKITLKVSHANFESSKTDLPDSFTGHFNGTGIAISNDGNKWYRLFNPTNGTSEQAQSINIDSKITEIKNSNPAFGYNSTFYIKFQHYGKSTFSKNGIDWLGGFEWDNIELLASDNVIKANTTINEFIDNKFSIPFTVANPNGISIYSAMMTLSFDKTVLEISDVTLTGGIFENKQAYKLRYNNADSGKIEIWISTENPSYPLVNTGGTICYVIFKTKTTMNQNTSVFFTKAELNGIPIYAGDGSFTLINTAPTISSISNQTIDEDKPTSNITITVSDKETPSNSLAMKLSSSDTNLVPTNSETFGGSGTTRTLVITPGINRSGTATITLTVTDGSNLTAQTTFSLTVRPVPDEPLIQVSDITGNEDASISFPITYALVDKDDSETLSSLTISNIPTGAKLSSGTDQGNGKWVLTPTQLSNLTITPPSNDDKDFKLTISGTTSEQGGSSATKTLDINVIVVSQVDPPDMTIPSKITGNSDTPIPFNIVITPKDPDNSEVITLNIENMKTEAKLSAGKNNGNGSWTVDFNDIKNLTVLPPRQDDSEFQLKLTFIVQEKKNQAKWSSEKTIDVEVIGYKVSGKMRYFKNDLPISNAVLSLKGLPSYEYTSTSDDSGTYTFSGICPGFYVLRASKQETEPRLGISSTDATKIAQFVNAPSALNCMEQIASEVSLNRQIGPEDLSKVAFYANQGLAVEDLNDSKIHWVFRIGTCQTEVSNIDYRQYTNLNADIANQDFIGLRLGDVTGNWPQKLNAPERRKRVERDTRKASTAYERLRVPIVLHDEQKIYGIDFTVYYDSTIFNPVKSDDSLSERLRERGYKSTYGAQYQDMVSIGIYASERTIYTGSGEVAFLEFDITTPEGTGTIELSDLNCNEETVKGGFIINNIEYQKLTVTKSQTGLQIKGTPINWISTINLQGEECEGRYKCHVTIGESTAISQISIPPDPPLYSCSMSVSGNELTDTKIKDIRTHNNQTCWILGINPHGNIGAPEEKTSSMTWNPSEFGNGIFELRQGYNCNGDVLIPNMKNITRYDFTNGNKIYYYSLVKKMCKDYSNADLNDAISLLKTLAGFKDLQYEAYPDCMLDSKTALEEVVKILKGNAWK